MHIPALFVNLREQLANELFRRRNGTRNSDGAFGRAVDSAVIWFLFTQMCDQRDVSPPKATQLGNACTESEFLSEFFSEFRETVVSSFSSPLPVEILGSVYEAFLHRTITLSRNGPRFESTGELRKSGGVYYTPQYIVDYIVEETVGKLIAGKSPEEMREVRVLDPACGVGWFLLRAYDRLVEEHVRWFRAHGDQERVTYSAKSGILENCIFGVDIDGLAVEVAKLSLYLKVMEGVTEPGEDESEEISSGGTSGAKAPGLRRSKTARLKPCPFKTNIQCGDSLLPARREGFDVVLGNPPYGAKLDAEMRAKLAKQFDAGTTETAALMMLQAARHLTRRGGVNGLIVPKAFTYSSNWEKVRGELLDEMTALVDVGKVWPAVKLEQVIYFLSKGEANNRYTNRKRSGERFENVAQIEKQHCGRFGFLLNGITREELEVGLKIQGAGSFLSDYVTNTRGAMFQDQVAKATRGRRVIGGKQIQRYRVEGEKGFLSSKIHLDKNAFVAAGSILVQNIIAHIENPVDHIKITAAVVDKKIAGEVVILDTVNQLKNRSKLSSYFFLAILNSRLMNWYVYRFIYAKAIRTMHFDGPVTGRIPVPRITPENQHLYNAIVREATGFEGSEAMEAAVCGLYGLSGEEVAFIESGMAGGKTHVGNQGR